MFRPTPFTQSDLARSIVARETRTKVRYFDPKTARMSGWMPKPPMLVAVRAMEAMAVKVRPVVASLRRVEFEKATVDQLRKFASESGVKNASRMRKADIIAALTA